MNYVTLSEDNQFSFVCPIFNAETKMSSCVKLRDLVWKGVRFEKRRGCQACMRAGKCPAAHIVQQIAMAGARRLQPDDYGSLTPVKGKLRKNVLERIQSVMVMDSVMRLFDVSEHEENMITTATDRITTMLGGAPGASSGRKPTIQGSTVRAGQKRKIVNPRTVTPDVPEIKNDIREAAASGDLSAALE